MLVQLLVFLAVPVIATSWLDGLEASLNLVNFGDCSSGPAMSLAGTSACSVARGESECAGTAGGDDCTEDWSDDEIGDASGDTQDIHRNVADELANFDKQFGSAAHHSSNE